MMSKNRLIIISPRQYGYQTDYLKYAEYLPEYYDVVFLCLDQGKEHIENNDIVLKYTSNKKNRKAAAWLFFIKVCIYLLLHKGVVMCANFKGCRYLKMLMPWRKMIVNIRTVSVERDVQVSQRQNVAILKDTCRFDRIIMISKGGAVQLKLPMDKVKIVSLGVDVISEADKSFDSLRLLYVGTLDNRDIIKTVEGFCRYVLNSNDCTATYDIVGDGDDFALISDYIKRHKLGDRVFMHGRKPYDALGSFFDKCNIGVSFVPMTAMYDFQPPTKTFEYINSGLFCIATETQANRDVISSGNGMLIRDSAEDFCNALQYVYEIRPTLSGRTIRETGRPYLWKNIIEKQLLPALRF